MRANNPVANAGRNCQIGNFAGARSGSIPTSSTGRRSKPPSTRCPTYGNRGGALREQNRRQAPFKRAAELRLRSSTSSIRATYSPSTCGMHHMSLRYSATIRGSSAHLVQGAGFTDSANKGIRSESQSTPVIRLAPCLPLANFPRAFDCPDPSPDRQGGARGSAEVSGLALSLLRLPDVSAPQPLLATLS